MLCCLPKCFPRVSHKWQTWTGPWLFLSLIYRSVKRLPKVRQLSRPRVPGCWLQALCSCTLPPLVPHFLWRSDSDSTLSERLIPDPSLWNCIPPAPQRTPWPCCAFLHSIPHCLTYSISSLLFHSLNYQSSILRSQTSFTAVAPASKCSCGINEQMNKLLLG